MISHFRRIFFPVFTTLSLLLCVVTIALAIRSYWYVDEAGLFLSGSRWSGYVVSYPGQWFIQITCDEKPRNDPTWISGDSWRLGPNGFPVCVAETVDPTGPTWAGFACYWDSIPESTVQPLSIKLPQWLLPVILAILPGWWVGRMVRRRLASPKDWLGCCPLCRYDLRAHQPGQKCPECGMPITVSAHQRLPAHPAGK